MFCKCLSQLVPFVYRPMSANLICIYSSNNIIQLKMCFFSQRNDGGAGVAIATMENVNEMLFRV